MATFKWESAESIASALTTELNSLANGSYSNASSAIANATGLYEFMALELVLASLTPTGTPTVSVFLLPTIDGTNYEDGGGATAPSPGTLIKAFSLSTSASAKRRTAYGIVLPPFGFKLVVLNSAGPSFAASGNTLKYARYNSASS
jgi:hypothetical protein